jgi:alkylation response protein AidB-like acyl-CoA dehydrogenase
VWAECASLGWFGLGLDEASGGVGYGATEEALLHREIGRHLTAGPVMATALAAHLAAGAGDSTMTDRFLAGETVASPMLATGDTVLLVDFERADYLLHVDETGASLYSMAAGLDVEIVPCIDDCTTLARARLTGAPAAAVNGPDLWLRMLLLGAATLTGIAERARDLSAQHARERHQFGAPIGVNQAIKHPCADMATRAELAGAQLHVAALAVDTGARHRRQEVLAAIIVATDAALANARATVQVHGGMGFTAGHDAHRLVKRAHLVDRCCGSQMAHLTKMLDD